jgi:hypothetical protein
VILHRTVASKLYIRRCVGQPLGGLVVSRVLQMQDDPSELCLNLFPKVPALVCLWDISAGEKHG